MKIFKIFALLITTFLYNHVAVAQKNFAEATLTYNIVIQTGSTVPAKGDALAGATSTVYLKGNNSRTDMVTSFGKEITIYNSKTNNAVILKEFSGQKLMITLSKEDWKAKNKMYSQVNFDLTGEYKKIGSYNVRKAIAKLSDGKSFEVYYAPDLNPSNKGYDATFTNLPGLAIEYEIESGKMTYKYSLADINYDQVQVSLFDFPTSGYRVMSYEENQKLKRGN